MKKGLSPSLIDGFSLWIRYVSALLATSFGARNFGSVAVRSVADTDELQAQGTAAFQAGEYEDAQLKWSQALRRRLRAAASRCAARLLHSPRGLTAELPSFARVDDSSILCERLREAGVTAATRDLERAVRAVINT